ncbi:hypothetical protein NP493_73g05064 [Ridgeia piscesae]|uniref:Uncharacterized protein n=1 Tax=Ridgeia piscesae TaxID=27915 RepID=A0AAD9UIM2_RIDPI|nr:hypothetical protein NP493_73g05064 [Ridgeia piscesae]
MALRLDHPLTSVIRDVDIQPRKTEDVPGNFIALNMRLVFDDTRSLFPASVYSQKIKKLNRWRSLYSSDFMPQMTKPEFQMTHIIRPIDKLFLEEAPPNIFNTWRVPERVTESRASQKAETRSPVKKLSRQGTVTPAVKTSTQFPQIGSRASDRRSKHSSSSAVPAPTPRAVPRSPVRASASPRLPTQGNNRLVSPERVMPRRSKSNRVKQMLEEYHGQSTARLTSLVQQLKHASDSDRRLVEKALRLVSRGEAESQTIKAWLQNATDADRQVALGVFKAMSENKVEGEEKDAVQRLIEELKGAQTQRSSDAGGRKAAADPEAYDPRMRYIRLLTPATRKNKWMHQTWHHLPTPREHKYENRSSMYTQPHKPTPHHFVIHPDWG